MTPINFHKKEKPLTSLASMGGGATGMAHAGLAEKIYLDDIFKTSLYIGNESTKTVTTGIDLTEDGGMVWGKSRGAAHAPFFYDTERGVEKYIRGDVWSGEVTLSSGLTGFTSTGFTLGSHVGMNDDVNNAAWTFKKTPGFFDVVKYTGNGVRGRQIAHSLGCQPGLILIKFLGGNQNWCVYHSSEGATKYANMNNVNIFDTATVTRFNNTEPTATHFTVGEDGEVNGSGEYIAYLFAGGPSSAATSRSVDFAGRTNNHDDELTPPSPLIPSGKDSTQFCLETWLRPDSANNQGSIYGQYVSGNSGRMFIQLDSTSSPYTLRFFVGGTDLLRVNNAFIAHQWHHFAWSYDGTNHRIFIDGHLKGTVAGSSLPGNIVQSTPRIGGFGETGYLFNGKMSNFRVVHGQAVYTSSFKPSTEPLTTTSQGVTGTNCKALCFNNTDILNNDGALGALTNPDSGQITASTDTPFLDPKGFKFGEESDQNIVKCGKYQGTGSANTVSVYCGWEPQWLLIKKASSNENWLMLDDMRGISNRGGNIGDKYLTANQYNAEADYDFVSLTPTGFKLTVVEGHTNSSGADYVYMAIRRPDPYVSKPVETGTDVFNINYGTSSSNPTFVSGFPVDFAIQRKPGQTQDWYTGSRLTYNRNLRTNTNAAEDVGASSSTWRWDFDNGWHNYSSDQTQNLSWMWKRHAGFDVVTYESGSPNITQFYHNLGRVPEMMWVKVMDQSGSWQVYHKAYNGGTNPENYFLELNQNYAQDNGDRWNYTAPTSTHFSLGAVDTVNGAASNNYEYIALLFASVDGISKVGSYDGTGSNLTITTGFSPRFLILKNITTTGNNWYTLDTTRGWASGNDNANYINANSAFDVHNFGNPTSTGFLLTAPYQSYNQTGQKYIYYAHA